MRIDRDLHDTHLQSMQGLALSVHAATQKPPRHVELRSTLEETLRRADRLLVEGIDRVLDPRTATGESTRLEDRLGAVARDLDHGRHVDLRSRKQGRARRLSSVTVDELYLIGREALTITFRHSGAQRITVTLDYEESFFRLVCADNGRGFDQTDLRDHTFRDAKHEGAKRSSCWKLHLHLSDRNWNLHYSYPPRQTGLR